jgi:hypothetical protein
MKNKNNYHRSFNIDDFDESVFEKFKTSDRFAEPDFGFRESRRFNREDDSFKCVSCKNWVSASREFSGVVHRNHCPLCLVSLHVDLNKAGDRRAACRSRMVAIGLTFKKVNKRYPGEGRGELMLIHRCTGCGKIKINRIAADDNPGLLSVLCETSLGLPESLLAELAGQGIHPLDSRGFDAAYFQLFGRQPIEIELVQIKVKVSIN